MGLGNVSLEEWPGPGLAYTKPSVGEISEPGDWSARETAQSLAVALDADIAPSVTSAVDLLVVGSQAAALPGRVAISAAAQYVIETSRCPVLVVPRGGRIRFSP